MSVHDLLTAAAIRVSVARSAHRQWADRDNDSGRTYVGAGHDAVKRIDDAISALHEARRTLIRELRADEDERAARIEAMLARRAQTPVLTLDALGVEDPVTAGEVPHPLED